MSSSDFGQVRPSAFLCKVLGFRGLSNKRIDCNRPAVSQPVSLHYRIRMPQGLRQGHSRQPHPAEQRPFSGSTCDTIHSLQCVMCSPGWCIASTGLIRGQCRDCASLGAVAILTVLGHQGGRFRSDCDRHVGLQYPGCDLAGSGAATAAKPPSRLPV
jgi:hypothetical protein